MSTNGLIGEKVLPWETRFNRASIEARAPFFFLNLVSTMRQSAIISLSLKSAADKNDFASSSALLSIV